jgi:hypothetical protein
MTDQHDLGELTEMIRLGLREQAIHPQGLNSSHTHGTLYPVDDPRNDETHLRQEPKLTSSKLMRTGIGSRRNWAK